LADCGKGKIWGTIDMMNAFFQTRMKPSDIPLTAVSTPFGLYEWCVMPPLFINAVLIRLYNILLVNFAIFTLMTLSSGLKVVTRMVYDASKIY
jgi:hypothetical protein